MAELLDELRPRAFAVAYRMLGSVTEAEDVVQEALVRLHRVLESGEKIEVPEAYLTTVVTRLGIDRLRSAQVRRETYVGEWLPEPVVTGDLNDPATHAEMSDSLSLAFLVLLERLSPEQRAVFLLRGCSTTATTTSPRSSARARPRAGSSPSAPVTTSSRKGRGSRRRATTRTSSPAGS